MGLRLDVLPFQSDRFHDLRANHFDISVPPGADICVQCRTSRREGHERLPKRVLYWAAEPLSLGQQLSTTTGAEMAYDAYTNTGVAVRRRGKLTFCLKTPRAFDAPPAASTTPRVWCRHLHFIPIHNRRIDVHNYTVHTVAVFPWSCDDDDDEQATRHAGRVPVVSSVSRTPTSYKPVFNPTMVYHYCCYALAPYEVAPKHTPLYIDFDGYVRSRRRGAVGIYAFDDRHADADADTDADTDADRGIASDDLVVHVSMRPATLHRFMIASAVHPSTSLVVYGANRTTRFGTQTVIRTLIELGYCNVQFYADGIQDAYQRLRPFASFVKRTPPTKASAGTVVATDAHPASSPDLLETLNRTIQDTIDTIMR